MKREFTVEANIGQPQVAYRETIRKDGVESEGPAPTPYLNHLAERLRQPPAQPVRNFNAFKKLLALNDIKLKRNQPGHGSRSVAHWIKTNIEQRVIIERNRVVP